jgi:N-acyl-D-amino-acid deacylase
VLDLLIENGTVIDGSGGPGQRGSVAIQEDKIVAVGRVAATEAHRRVDASGLVVAPGFVDPHSHTDWSVHANRRAESTIRQGVTTEIVGNCGVTNAPVSAASRAAVAARLTMYGYEGYPTWESFGEYLEDVEREGTSQNLAWLVGHSTIRAAAGVGAREPTDEELARMEAYVGEAMEAGALGLSSGLEYGEGRFAAEPELLRLVAVVGRYAGYYASHIRNRDANILEAVSEFLRLTTQTGVHGQISHLNVRYDTGAPPGAWEDAVGLMAAARARGADVQADMTPFQQGLGLMTGLLPSWLMKDGPARASILLADPDVRRRVREDADRYWRFVYRGQWDRVRLLSSEQFPELDGLLFPEIAAMRHTDEWSALFDILQAAGPKMEHMLMLGSLFSAEDLAEQLRHPLFSCGVDAYSSSISGRVGVMASTPLSFAGHIEYLKTHVRERGTLSLEEMVRKLTSAPASRFGLRGRGRIAEGYFADVVVFDAGGVTSRSTFAKPAVYPTGISHVMVNGQLVVDQEEHTGVYSGRVLRP